MAWKNKIIESYENMYSPAQVNLKGHTSYKPFTPSGVPPLVSSGGVDYAAREKYYANQYSLDLQRQKSRQLQKSENESKSSLPETPAQNPRFYGPNNSFQSWGPPTPSSSSAGIKTTFFGPYGRTSSNEDLLSSARAFSFSRPPQLDSSFYQGNQTSTFPAGGMGSPSAAYPAGGMGSPSAAYPAGGGKNQNINDYFELPAGYKPPPPKADGSPFYSGSPQPSGSPSFFGNLTWTRKAY
jgi:hypothetical protein